MPVLVHDGNTIVESSVICAYLDEVFPAPPLSPKDPSRRDMRLWCKLPDDILPMACATVSFAICFGQQLKKQMGAGLEERLMKMPDPARRDRQRALIEKGIETPFFRDHIKVFEKTFGEMEAQLGKTKWLASDMYTLADAEMTPYVERIDGWGWPACGRTGRTWRLGSAHKGASELRGDPTTGRPITMTRDETGSSIGRGSSS